MALRRNTGARRLPTWRIWNPRDRADRLLAAELVLQLPDVSFSSASGERRPNGANADAAEVGEDDTGSYDGGEVQKAASTWAGGDKEQYVDALPRADGVEPDQDDDQAGPSEPRATVPPEATGNEVAGAEDGAFIFQLSE
jgi:hypothetical protein